MKSRVRAALVVGLVLAAQAAAAPAFASNPQDPGSSGGNGAGLTVVQTLLLYLVAPVVIFGIITLLVVGPSMTRSRSDENDGVREPVLGVSPQPTARPEHQRSA